MVRFGPNQSTFAIRNSLQLFIKIFTKFISKMRRNSLKRMKNKIKKWLPRSHPRRFQLLAVILAITRAVTLAVVEVNTPLQLMWAISELAPSRNSLPMPRMVLDPDWTQTIRPICRLTFWRISLCPRSLICRLKKRKKKKKWRLRMSLSQTPQTSQSLI